MFDITETMSKEQLTTDMTEKIENYLEEDKEDYANFFSDGLNRLLKNLERMNQIILGLAPETDAKNFGENIFQNQYYANNDAMNLSSTDKLHVEMFV